jgi:cobalt-zinc-cadmium efflux system outer membrane protein
MQKMLAYIVKPICRCKLPSSNCPILGDADKSIRIGLNPQSLWPSSTHQQVQEYLADNLFEKSRQLQVLQAKATVAQLKASARPNPTVNLGVNRTRSPETRLTML